MKMGDLADQPRATGMIQPVTQSTVDASRSCPPTFPMGPASPGIQWIELKWEPLTDEPFLIVSEKRWLKEARREHPGKVIYFPAELTELKRFKHDQEMLKFLHQAKKEFGGWIVPQDSPEYVPFEKLRGSIEDR